MAKKTGKSLKRALDEDLKASLLNLETGEMIDIPYDQKFYIGRARSCDLMIEQAYISRTHSIIDYVNNQFILYTISKSSITYLNCKQLEAGKSNYKIIEHGDVIGFGEPKQIKNSYKFIESTNTKKKIKLAEDNTESNKECECEDLSLQTEYFSKFLKDIGDDFSVLKTNCAALVKKVNNRCLKYKMKISDLNMKIESILKKSKDSLDALKKQLNVFLEDNFQCYVCNEVVVKATTGICNHSFCESCITTWLKRSNLCPVCRTKIDSTSNYIAIDNYLSELYDLLGGTIKEQRVALEKERNMHPLRVRPMPRFQPMLRGNIGPIEVVDLTHF